MASFTLRVADAPFTRVRTDCSAVASAVMLASNVPPRAHPPEKEARFPYAARWYQITMWRKRVARVTTLVALGGGVACCGNVLRSEPNPLGDGGGQSYDATNEGSETLGSDAIGSTDGSVFMSDDASDTGRVGDVTPGNGRDGGDADDDGNVGDDGEPMSNDSGGICVPYLESCSPYGVRCCGSSMCTNGFCYIGPK